MMTNLAAILSGLLALTYAVRANWLRFGDQEVTFVVQHILGGIACVYSTYSLYTHGLGVLEIVAPLMAAVYLVRSKRSFEVAKTGHGDLWPGSGPETWPDIDSTHLRRVSGGKQ